MAADNPNTIVFELEGDNFDLKRNGNETAFYYNGDLMAKDLPSAKIDLETGEAFFMGRKAGKIDDSADIAGMAATVSSWFPPGLVEHAHSTADFDEKNTAGIVVAKFSATWCGPCKMVAPKVDKMSREFPDVKFIHIDGDECKELMSREGANCYPTFMFWKDGEKKESVVKGADVAQVRAIIESLGAQPVALESNSAGDGEVHIQLARDSYVIEKEAAGFSLTVNGVKKMTAKQFPGLELERSTRKVTIGRGGGAIFVSPEYDVEAIMDKLELWFPNKVKHCHTTEDFDEIVKNNEFVVAKYSANWCGPCHAIAPFIRDLSVKHENIVFLHIDVDEVKPLSQREGIQAMPTFDFWKGGVKQADKRVRGGNRPQIKANVEAFGEN